jgi:hypothetical protein
MQPKLILTSALWLAVTEAAHAQGAAFSTPGMPGNSIPGAGYGGNLGQTTRFSNEFNPAIGFAIDGFGDYTFFHDHGSEDDGFTLKLRTLEMTASSWVDPNAWAYVVLASDGTSLNLEEAAVHYIGLGGNTTLRAGRFFIDFGKQMQGHIHDLRTVDRPAVLSAYLGEEVHGDGLEFDNWFAAGETAAVRYSFGVFADLIPETFEGAGNDITASVDDRKKFEHLNFTARITGFEDIGETGVGQIGASARILPQYTLSSGAAGVPDQTDLSNTVYGVDATYGWSDDTGIKKWTFGGEGLLLNGDAGGMLDSLTTPTAIQIARGNFFGFYAFGDYQWDRFNSAGVQYSRFEQPALGKPDEDAVEAYYSHSLSEFQRLRFAVQYEHNEIASDSTRFIIQYTNFLGAHSHGVNW